MAKKYKSDKERLLACYERRIREIKKGNSVKWLNGIIIKLEKKVNRTKI